MRPRKSLLTAVVIGLCVTAVGCGERQRQTPDAQPLEQPEGPGLTSVEVQREDATTRWADGYCLAVAELVRSMSTMPMIDPSTTQRATRTSSEMLGTVISGLDRTMSKLRELDDAPVPAGERVRAKAIADYGAIRERAAGVKKELDAAAADPAASRQAISAASRPLDEIGEINLLAGFESAPELATARDRAQACRDLTEQGPEPRLGY